MNERILRQDDAGVCTLTLSRPDKLNALDGLTFEELDAHCAALEDGTDTIGCVVLRAEGRAFCAGADLGSIALPRSDRRWKPRVIERLARLPQPVIAAVHGVCFTGGLELALACDFILADASARFADTHGRWGFVGEWGLTQRLPRRIGLAQAKRMMLTAREIGAEEALALGLIDLLAEPGGLDPLVSGLAANILANSWFTNMATKRLLRETDGMTLDAALSHDHYRHPGFAPDHQERIARFGKK